jgi:hypothetical protein
MPLRAPEAFPGAPVSPLLPAILRFARNTGRSAAGVQQHVADHATDSRRAGCGSRWPALRGGGWSTC